MEAVIDRELKRGTLELILLRLLAGEPMYGYQIVAMLEERANGLFGLKEGTLYPVLYRLEDAGLVEARWEAQRRGVPRKYYTLTAAGRERLEALISEWQSFSSAVNRLLEWEEATE